MQKKFILNADDFGLSKDLNRAVLEGYQAGLLKSASLVANGEAFDEAIGIIKNQLRKPLVTMTEEEKADFYTVMDKYIK